MPITAYCPQCRTQQEFIEVDPSIGFACECGYIDNLLSERSQYRSTLNEELLDEYTEGVLSRRKTWQEEDLEYQIRQRLSLLASSLFHSNPSAVSLNHQEKTPNAFYDRSYQMYLRMRRFDEKPTASGKTKHVRPDGPRLAYQLVIAMCFAIHELNLLLAKDDIGQDVVKVAFEGRVGRSAVKMPLPIEVEDRCTSGRGGIMHATYFQKRWLELADVCKVDVSDIACIMRDVVYVVYFIRRLVKAEGNLFAEMCGYDLDSAEVDSRNAEDDDSTNCDEEGSDPSTDDRRLRPFDLASLWELSDPDWSSIIRTTYSLAQLSMSQRQSEPHSRIFTHKSAPHSIAITLVLWSIIAHQQEYMLRVDSLLLVIAREWGGAESSAGARFIDFRRYLVMRAAEFEERGMEIPVLPRPIRTGKGEVGDGLKGYAGDRRRGVPESDVAAAAVRVVAERWREFAGLESEVESTGSAAHLRKKGTPGKSGAKQTSKPIVQGGTTTSPAKAIWSSKEKPRTYAQALHLARTTLAKVTNDAMPTWRTEKGQGGLSQLRQMYSKSCSPLSPTPGISTQLIDSAASPANSSNENAEGPAPEPRQTADTDSRAPTTSGERSSGKRILDTQESADCCNAKRAKREHGDLDRCSASVIVCGHRKSPPDGDLPSQPTLVTATPSNNASPPAGSPMRTPTSPRSPMKSDTTRPTNFQLDEIATRARVYLLQAEYWRVENTIYRPSRNKLVASREPPRARAQREYRLKVASDNMDLSLTYHAFLSDLSCGGVADHIEAFRRAAFWLMSIGRDWRGLSTGTAELKLGIERVEMDLTNGVQSKEVWGPMDVRREHDAAGKEGKAKGKGNRDHWVIEPWGKVEVPRRQGLSETAMMRVVGHGEVVRDKRAAHAHVVKPPGPTSNLATTVVGSGRASVAKEGSEIISEPINAPARGRTLLKGLAAERERFDDKEWSTIRCKRETADTPPGVVSSDHHETLPRLEDEKQEQDVEMLFAVPIMSG